MATRNGNGAPRSLGEGFVVRASVLGKLLGVRLLTLEARVVVAPPGDEADVVIAARPVSSRALPRGGGGGLAEAAELIDQGEGLLAAARRNGAGT